MTPDFTRYHPYPWWPYVAELLNDRQRERTYQMLVKMDAAYAGMVARHWQFCVFCLCECMKRYGKAGGRSANMSGVEDAMAAIDNFVFCPSPPQSPHRGEDRNRPPHSPQRGEDRRDGGVWWNEGLRASLDFVDFFDR